MYADHLAVVCYNENHLKKVIQSIGGWSQENGLNINKNKSEIIQILGKKQRKQITTKNINGIPIVQTYKYLGIHINDQTSLEHHYEQIKAKISYLIYTKVDSDITDNSKI